MQLQDAKYELLSEQQQQEVQNFINDLLRKNTTGNDFNASKYKKKVLKVSTWSEKEVSVFERNNKLFKKWTPTTW